MKRLALVMHFYQPPVQDLAVTKQVLASAYLPVLRTIVAHPRARVTLNITACLLQQLEKLQKWEFFTLVKEAYKMGKIELLNGLAYHPILPLVSRTTVDRQFKETEDIYMRLLGISPGMGIFCPELAITSESGKMLAKYGKYTLIDKTSLGDSGSTIEPALPAGRSGMTRSSVVDFEGMRAYVNDRSVCDVLRSYPVALSGKKLAGWIADQMPENSADVVVTDVEVFGHHYEERLTTLIELFDSLDLEFVTLNDLEDLPAQKVEVRDSSWQHVPKDKHQTGPFWLWNNPDNPLQKRYWELAARAEEMAGLARKATDTLYFDTATQHLDRGLSSCYPYWISNWPWWHPDLVERGAQELARCVRTLNIDRTQKSDFEALYHLFLNDLWKLHWSGQVEENYAQFEIERKMLVSELPDLG